MQIFLKINISYFIIFINILFHVYVVKEQLHLHKGKNYYSILYSKTINIKKKKKESNINDYDCAQFYNMEKNKARRILK